MLLLLMLLLLHSLLLLMLLGLCGLRIEWLLLSWSWLHLRRMLQLGTVRRRHRR
jgi:hypothetical protein